MMADEFHLGQFSLRQKITVGQTPKVSEFWLSKNVRTLKNVHLCVIIIFGRAN